MITPQTVKLEQIPMLDGSVQFIQAVPVGIFQEIMPASVEFNIHVPVCCLIYWTV